MDKLSTVMNVDKCTGYTVHNKYLQWTLYTVNMLSVHTLHNKHVPCMSKQNKDSKVYQR